MLRIVADLPLGTPPSWAILERSLFDLVGEAPDLFEARFCRPDGSLIWRSTLLDRDGRVGMSSRGSPARDGGDDFYEPFRAWPIAYMLGGPPSLLQRSRRHWEGVTRQLTALGLVEREYCLGFDWYHQSEGNALFQFLALADPGDPLLKERAERFAGFLLNEGVTEPIYDPIHRIIRASHTGSGGPRWGIRGDPAAWWIPSDAWILERLPYEDIPGLETFEDLLDPARGHRMAVAMEERMGRGDTAVNLLSTSLATTAYLLTGEERFRDWVLEYVDGWIERSRPFGGLIPDNVGLDGEVGTYLGGRWYGANYGWTWPFGYFSVAMAATVAAQNAHLLTGDQRYIDFAAGLIETMWDRGEVRDIRKPMTLGFTLSNEFAALRGREEMWLIPYRHGDSGWFDWQPMTMAFPMALWAASGEAGDLDRARHVSTMGDLDRQLVLSTFTRDDNGHERPWLEYLDGRHPTYPDEALLMAHDQVRRRVDRILADDVDLEMVDVDDWQLFNPVTVEVLCQLTLGAPPPIYNGGLLFAPVAYVDEAGRRPGLPHGVAALVRHVDDRSVRLELVNLDPEPRTVIIQAGAYGEHRFSEASYRRRVSDYPGGRAYRGSRWYGAEPLRVVEEIVDVDDVHLVVEMRPNTRIDLELGLRRNVGTPRLRPAPDPG